MRLWMVDPSTMCRQHLLGEHCECHMFYGAMKKGTKMDGYVNKHYLEVRSLQKRHDDLAIELVNRGYNHKSPLIVESCVLDSLSDFVRNSLMNEHMGMVDLHTRCNECRIKYQKYN